MSTSNDFPSLYENKENIQEHPEIPNINKITADDMNTIKILLNNATYVDIENLKNVNNETINPKIPRYEEKNYIVLSLNAKQNISQGNYNVNFTQASIPAIAVDLKANDVINMKVDYGSTAGNPSIRNGKANTFLSVVEI